MLISISACHDPVVMTPEPYTPGSETFTITTTEVLVTLESELDFEVTQSYTLILKVVDTGTTSTGSLVIRVNTYCVPVIIVQIGSRLKIIILSMLVKLKIT